MKTYTFCMPIVEGKEALLQSRTKRWIREERDAWAESRKAAGIARERGWIQHTPQGPVLVLAHDVEDLDKAFRTIAESDRPFDVEFRKHVHETHGMELTADNAPSVRELEAWTDSDQPRDQKHWALAFPVRNGSFDEVAEWAHTVWSHDQFEAARRDAGVHKQVLCWQDTPQGAFVCLYAEGDGLKNAVEHVTQRNYEVDGLWLDGIERFVGLTVTGFDALPRVETVMDAEAFHPARA